MSENLQQPAKIIVHYCCGNFLQSTGGVPRYDYQIYCAFKNRVFFKGPNQKQKYVTISLEI